MELGSGHGCQMELIEGTLLAVERKGIRGGEEDLLIPREVGKEVGPYDTWGRGEWRSWFRGWRLES